MTLGLVASIVLAHGSILHALGMIIFGLLLGMIGTDVNSGAARFGLPELADGIGFVIVAMGLFGVGEIIANLEHESTRSVMVKSVTGLMPTREDFKRMIGPVLRGTALGSALGILPGGGARWPRSAPMRWRRGSRATGRSSARAPSRALPRRNRPTTPAPR